MSTLKEISKVSGVSISAVSRIISQDVTLNISPDKRQRVLKIAKELGYKSPKQRKPKTNIKIALIHWYTRKQELEDTYYLSIRLGIEKAAHELGITLVK